MNGTAPAVETTIALTELCDQLRDRGRAVCDDLVPRSVAEALYGQVLTLPDGSFRPASVGREQDQERNPFVRRDETCWLDDGTPPGAAFLAWIEGLRRALNARLFLGLFDYECHFARYRPGAFYGTHLDAFRGRSNRVLSTVFYLNPAWADGDGGHLVLFEPDRRTEVTRIAPLFGRFVVFLSEDWPHEVLPAQRTRWSVAGWFRVNATTARRLDPPR